MKLKEWIHCPLSLCDSRIALPSSSCDGLCFRTFMPSHAHSLFVSQHCIWNVDSIPLCRGNDCSCPYFFVGPGRPVITADRIAIAVFIFVQGFDLFLSCGELYLIGLFKLDLMIAFRIKRFSFNDQLALCIRFLNKICISTFFEDPGGFTIRFVMSTFSVWNKIKFV